MNRTQLKSDAPMTRLPAGWLAEGWLHGDAARVWQVCPHNPTVTNRLLIKPSLSARRQEAWYVKHEQVTAATYRANRDLLLALAGLTLPFTRF